MTDWKTGLLFFLVYRHSVSGLLAFYYEKTFRDRSSGFEFNLIMKKFLIFFLSLIRIIIGIYLYNHMKRKIYTFFSLKKLTYKKDIIYVLHIGKAGGTPLGYMFKNVINNNPKYKLKFIKPDHHIKLYFLDENQKYIFNIRDPISRYYSGFFSRLRRGAPWLNNEHSLLEKISFFYYSDSNKLAENLYSNNFFKRLTAIFSIRAIKSINEPLLSWFNIKDLEKHKPDFIFNQKTLDNDYLNFCKKFNIQFSSLPKDIINSHKSNYANSPKLSDLAKQNLNRYYKKDIELYNYIIELKNKLKY